MAAESTRFDASPPRQNRQRSRLISLALLLLKLRKVRKDKQSDPKGTG